MSKEEQFAAESFRPFVQHLYAHLYHKYEKTNLFFSPLSVYSSLALALCGASGQTHHDIAHTLNVKTAHGRDYDTTLKHLGERIAEIKESDKLGTLMMANGMFLDCELKVNHLFKEEVTKYFNGECKHLHFQSDAKGACDEVNKWVASNTGDKIKELMSSDQIDSDTKLVLANAVYFKGTWERVFHREVTHDAPFIKLSGEEVTVKMMKQNGVFKTHDFAGIQATCVRIPFKSCYMLIVVPYEKNGLPQILQHLLNEHNRSHFDELFDDSKYSDDRIDLCLPKFNLGTSGKSMDLKEPVSLMGAAPLFDPNRCDLEKITTEMKLYVTAMVHKATIEVNEEGAEAAAATGMAIAPMMLVPTITADHPFLFFIVTNNNFPVFAGHVMNPLEE